MRKIAMILVVASAALGSVFASTTFTKHPVEVPAMQFDARLSDGLVIATWRRYKPADFDSYQLLKSSTDASAMYPDVPALFSSTDANTIRYKDGSLSPGVWYYRLCIVTHFGDRWISPAVKVTVRDTDIPRPPPTSADFEETNQLPPLSR